MSGLSDKLIVALDVDKDKAKSLVDILYPTVKRFKVGSQLFTACGPAAVEMVGRKGGSVFLDLKFHDIPNTVYLATQSGTTCAFVNITENNIFRNVPIPPVFMMTVHVAGGKKMLVEAAKSAKEISEDLKIPKPYIIGVTRLTSDEYNENMQAEVVSSAMLAKEAGLEGVVCSAQEAAAVRKACGGDFIIVTPGIRLKGAPAGDQKRIATAQEAIAAGADYLVVGRPIVESDNPLGAAQKILDEIREAVSSR